MAAPLTGFTPLLLSFLALHLLLLGPLLAFTSGRASLGGASTRWTRGLCHREACKVDRHRCEDAGELPRGGRNLSACRWTVEWIQPEGCSGLKRRWGLRGGYQWDGSRWARRKRLKGAGTFGVRADEASLPRAGLTRGANSDGVGAEEGVHRGVVERKGVVSPPSSPAFTFVLMQNGKKRAVQRTKTCAQSCPVPGPHLAKRGAAGAFVHASGIRTGPGSRQLKRERVRERAFGVSSSTSVYCVNRKTRVLTNKRTPGCFLSSPSWRKPPLSGYKLPHIDASSNSFQCNHVLTNTSEWTAKQRYVCPTFESSQTALTDLLEQQAAAALRGSVGADRKAGNCSHFGRHSLIDPSSSSSREGVDDSWMTGCITSRKGRHGGGADVWAKNAHKCSSHVLIRNASEAPRGCWLSSFPYANAKSIHARNMGEGREVKGGRGGGGAAFLGNKYMHLSNWADNGLAFSIRGLSVNEALSGGSAPATAGQLGQSSGLSDGCFREIGGGCCAVSMTPQRGVAKMNPLIQFNLSSITQTPARHSLFNKSVSPRAESVRARAQSDYRAERGKPALTPSAEKVKATPESDSGFFLPAKFPVTSPGAASDSTDSAAAAAAAAAAPQSCSITARHPSLSPEQNQSTWLRGSPCSPSVSEISGPRTAPRVFLWSRFNSNNNNNNNKEGGTERKGCGHKSHKGTSSWHSQTQQREESAVPAGCTDSTSNISATGAGEGALVHLKFSNQVPLEPEGVRHLDRQQMGAGEEREKREGEGSERSTAVWGGKLQVGEGEREALLMEGRELQAEEEEEVQNEGVKGLTKAGEERGAQEQKGHVSDGGTNSQLDSVGRIGESQVNESYQGGKSEVQGEKNPTSRGERSLERLIIVGDDDTSQGEKERRILMPWSRSRRAANRHPHFSLYNYQVQVAENQPPSTSVIIMSATDPDAGDAGRVSYSMAPLMNSRSSDYFDIHPNTGLITTTQMLDREHMDLHYFRVTATDHGSPRLSGTTMVAIAVSDRNDHSPIFEHTEYRETIRENVEEGYPILQLRATDSDSPSNANIRYRFVGDTAAMARVAFEIDPRSGLITTHGSVDRETNEHYTLHVEASDQGKDPGPRSATVKVFITVLDENDNVPQFSEKRYVVAVKEDVRPHSEILRVSATDRDKDSNAAVHYNIISGNSRGQFSIDSVTGEIQVVAPLDYESEREYTLRVRAQDNGRPPLSNNTGIVSVQVTDVNDNPPIFVSTPFQASVLESAPVGSSILHIQAIDTDSSDNARLEYRLTGTGSDTPFIINSATGWVTVSSILDRESVEHYFFGVEARDYGMPPLSATASVTITVMDVNDNRPEFLQKEYYGRLNEDAVVGTSVVTVTAVDRDVNSAVTYQISGGNTRNRFAISTAGGAGLLSLALPLDYKQERRYVLTVTASDRTLHDTCQVHINITDANTHRPVFQSAHYSVSVNEDQPPGSTVVVISATDDDVGENARITYLLEDNIPQFRIDPATGAITLQAELDYEDMMTYTLAITAKDNGIPQKSDTTYVEVNVNDVNDNAPQFLSPRYQGTVSEDAPPFTSVLQISATDRDAHANGRVQYTFQNGEDGDGDFTIEPTSGIVRTVRRLDRESVPFYELTAYAVDRGVPPQRTPVHIQVTVLDVNDNAPVFPADDFEVLVKENSAVGSVVAQITATDPDEGANAQIMYQIVEGNIPEIFQMDIFSGELTSLIDLDYEARNEYVIVVQATSAPLVSRATVRIRLVDQNDNRPTLQDFHIIFNNFVSNRSNSFPSGVIGRVPAHDPDVSDRLYYTIDRGNELHLLLLNHTSGEIRLSRKLDNNRPLVAPMLITVTGKMSWKGEMCGKHGKRGCVHV